MCDNHSLDDMYEHLRKTGADMSRRRFGLLSAGAGLAATLPRVANAVEVHDMNVVVKTPDGEAECYFVHPTSGRSPAVLIWVDAFGLRPAMQQMAKRLAESGYAVLAPNPYYRTAKVPALPAGLSFSVPAERDQLMKMMGTLNADTTVRDTRAFISYLDSQSVVDTRRRAGVMGYCMGGPMAMRTAAERADRVGAVASFHGGGLVTTQPNSPHLLIPKMKAAFLIAVADNDDKQEPEAKNVLREAFNKAGQKAEIEVYAGAQHGWCPPDSAVYNEAAAEKAWSRLLALLQGALA